MAAGWGALLSAGYICVISVCVCGGGGEIHILILDAIPLYKNWVLPVELTVCLSFFPWIL